MASDLSIHRFSGFIGQYSLPAYQDNRQFRLDGQETAFYTYGTSGDGAAAYVYSKSFSTASTQSLSLDSGAIDDPFGDPLTFTAIREIWIANDSTDNDLAVTGLLLDSIYGQASISTVVAPGEVYHRGRPVGSGFAVTNGVSDTLVMDPGGVSTAWKVVLLGV